MHKLTFLALLLLISLTSFGQYDKTKVNKKAMNAFTDAQQKMALMQVDEARKDLEKAILFDPKFCDALILLGDICRDKKENDKAISYYEKAIAVDETYAGRKYRSIATIKANQGKLAEAQTALNQFLQQPKISSQELNLAKRELANYQFMEQAMQQQVPFVYQNLGDSINSPNRDYSPSITADGETLIFNRQLGEGPKGNEDFYISKKINGRWSPAKNMGAPINTDNNEGAQCLSADGNYIFYTICNNKRYMSSGCDIYLSRRVGDTWMDPKPLDENINTGEWESQPSYSADGNYLFFAAHHSREGYGGTDLYMSTLGADGHWSKPENLGAAINTSGDEQSPFIHPDGQTLYFASNGLPGMGKMDLFVVRKTKDGKWGTPKNLGYPINTTENETNLVVAADGKTAFFASSMGKGGNNLDIYTFQLYPEIQAQHVLYMKGVITDAKNSNPVAAYIQLIDLETGEIAMETMSDKADGHYLFCIPPGKNYALNVSHPNYLFYSENFSLKNHPVDHPYVKDVAMQKMDVGQTVVLNNVFFESDRFDLEPESKVELNKLVQFLKDNPTLHIELGGHTDNSGTKEQNQTLSTNRAKAVYTYLVSKGIATERLSYKGYADSKPLASNDTPEGKAKNRRTEFKVTQK